jgi:hypothetical protein
MDMDMDMDMGMKKSCLNVKCLFMIVINKKLIVSFKIF